MKKWRILTIAMALPVLLAIGCATPAHVEKDDTANFSSYKTFAWINSDAKDGKSDSAKENGRKNDLLDRHVQQTVNKELEKLGWKEDKSRPDVLISYDLLVEKTTRELSNPVYSRPYSRVFYNPYLRRYGTIYYPSTFLGYDGGTVTVREGTLTVTMVDAKTDHTIWQGWTTDEVSSRNVTQKEVQASVKSIFRKFDMVTQ